MAATFLTGGFEGDDIEKGDAISALAYTYLDYASEQLQKEGKAENETQAIAMAIEELLSNYTDEEIDNETFTIDDFISIFAKYISDNENEPISDAVVSGIINIVPEENRWFLSMFRSFDKNNTSDHVVTVEEGLKAYIKACYYGADPECALGESYKEPEDVRNLLCMTMVMALSSDAPEINDLFKDENGELSGKAAKFEDAVGIILNKIKTVKDEEGNVIKTYLNISEMADDKLVKLLDSVLTGAIEKSEELYGQQYKIEFQNQFNNLKANITKARKTISALFFYTDGGFNSKDVIENTVTFVDNATLIPIAHYNEIYLAESRAANRYEEHKTVQEYECIEGNGQTFEVTKDGKLSFEFNIDYEQFVEEGKVFINSKEVPREKYSISRGSTIITFNEDYIKSLGEGEYVLVAEVYNGAAQAEFTITKTESTENADEEETDEKKTEEKSNNINIDSANSPKTGDNIVLWTVLALISFIVVVGTKIFSEKNI